MHFHFAHILMKSEFKLLYPWLVVMVAVFCENIISCLDKRVMQCFLGLLRLLENCRT
jgi:hypothetical protein